MLVTSILWFCLLSSALVAAPRSAWQTHNSSKLKATSEVWENRQSLKDRMVENGGLTSFKTADFPTWEARTTKDRKPHAQIESWSLMASYPHFPKFTQY